MIDLIITILLIIFLLYLLSNKKQIPKDIEKFIGSGALIQMYARDPQDSYQMTGINRYVYPNRYLRKLWYNDYLFDMAYAYPFYSPFSYLFM